MPERGLKCCLPLAPILLGVLSGLPLTTLWENAEPWGGGRAGTLPSCKCPATGEGLPEERKTRALWRHGLTPGKPGRGSCGTSPCTMLSRWNRNPCAAEVPLLVF